MLGSAQKWAATITRAPYGGILAEARLGRVRLSAGLNEHARQCDQRWRFRLRVSLKMGPRHLSGGWRHFILGYRSRGDAKPSYATWDDAGFWWPWQVRRTCSGSY